MGTSNQTVHNSNAYSGTHFSARRQLRPNYYYRPGQNNAYSGTSAARDHTMKSWALRGSVVAACLLITTFVLPHALKRPQVASIAPEPTSPQGKVEAAVTTKPALPAKQTATDEQLAIAINKAISAHAGIETSVNITDINSGRTYHYGLSEDIVYVAASVAKVITATYYLHLTEEGKYTLDKSVGGATASKQITDMIEQSDNAAWDALNKLLTWKSLGEYGKSIGLAHYDPTKNTLTTGDIALLFTKIQQGALLNKQNNDFLLEKLKNANRTDFIKAAVPSSVSVYHKAGWLDDRSHDAAIIDDGRDPYVLVIFTKGSAGGTAARTDVIHDVTKATADRFIGTTAANAPATQ